MIYIQIAILFVLFMAIVVNILRLIDWGDKCKHCGGQMQWWDDKKSYCEDCGECD